MTRHTREAVDKALDLGEHIRRSAALDYDKGDWRLDAAEDRAKRADILADEVRALREELEQAKGAVLYHICLSLKATIARVEALPARWMDYVVFDSGGVPDCAKDLEAALKGDA